MISYKNKSLTAKAKLRLQLLWGTLILMIVYMVAIGEMGLGDSRTMTKLAEGVSRIIFFGSMVYVIVRIVRIKKLLADKTLLFEQQREQADERWHFLHTKSGGIVVDILLLILLFVTCTTALWNMPAFYVSLSLLVATIGLKLGSYYFYQKMY